MPNHSKLIPFNQLLAVIFFVAAAGAAEPTEVTEAKAKQWEAISVGPFADSIHHATMSNEKKKVPDPQYTPVQIVHIAENLLAWQNPDGGWPKNKNWLKILSADELAQLPAATGKASAGHSTFDNSNTWTQIEYLARVHQQTHLKRYADAALKAIEYTLTEHRDSGGWRGSDVDAITFNDGVMAGILRIFKAIIEDRELYPFVDEPLRKQVRKAYDRGLECILKCQIRVNGRLTAWCQQHDHKTFAPVWARTFEPPSIVSAESVGVVRLLMSIDNPSPEIIASIQAAVAWFDHVKIHGIRIENIKAEPIQFNYHWSDTDRVEVKDPQAPPIWTRYYDLKTEKPIFCTRQRKITEKYTDLSRERRTGYSWYGYYPAKLLEKDYPVWQQKWAPQHNVLSGD
ncbi:MAG: pectate lyase [Sedimentisphaerales bacterium]|nr:pectate lyase [Sedimentisphaerales bacterium]